MKALQVEIHLFYKYGTIYREVVYVRSFEACQLLEFGTSNVLTKFVLDMANQSMPGFIHNCPYKKVNVTKGIIKALNAGSTYPSGDYKSNILFTVANQKFLGSLHFVVSVNSSNRDSFG